MIGASYTYSKYSLADVLVPYQVTHPECKIRIVNDSSDALYRQVLDGSVDVGFLRGDYEGPVNRTLLGETQGFLVSKRLWNCPASRNLTGWTIRQMKNDRDPDQVVGNVFCERLPARNDGRAH